VNIAELIEKDIAFMGSDWQPDETVKDGPFPGQRCVGEKPCIMCNDFFYWACADCEDINESTMPILEKAISDCSGDIQWGALLYCARQRKERPQGAFYSIIPKELWSLFNDCGPEREIDIGNPFKPGEYKS
jgi:hypothetical protein